MILFIGAVSKSLSFETILAAEDLEEADKLAYNLVMVALTLAVEAMPTALAAYNHKEVLATVPLGSPGEALKSALKLTQSITIVEPSEKVLQSAEMRRLRRSIGQFEQINGDSTQRLIDVLRLEYEANMKAAMNHPAGRALAKIVDGTPPPATITVVSSSLSINDDALSITLEKQ